MQRDAINLELRCVVVKNINNVKDIILNMLIKALINILEI